MAEAAFSEDGKYYSAITQDGRLRIWDTETNVLKQEYTPDLHLTAPPSCLQWINVSYSTNTLKRGRRNSNVSGEEAQCIALGTTSGKILIYSITQAKVESVLFSGKNSEVSQPKVNALDWSKKYGLFSCSKDNKVTEWDLQSASVRFKYNVYVENNIKQGNNVNAIKIIPHNQNTPARFLVTASWQVRIWRLHSGNSMLVKCLGHNTSQNSLLQLVSLNDSCWLIEGSQNERLLSFWDVTITEETVPQQNGDEPSPNKRQRKKSMSKTLIINTPMYSFVLEDAPRIVDACLKEQGGAELSLAAATRSGVVHYYGHMLNGSSTKPIKPSVTIQVTSVDARPLPLQCCRLQPDGYLLLGYIKEPSLVFEKITPELKTKTQILIREEAKVTSKKTKQKNEVNKVRSDANSNAVSYVEPLEVVSRKRATPGGQIEVPMEARLENLAIDTTQRSRNPVSQNLTKLLIQGLHSKDKKIILTVLQNNNDKVAKSTVSNLPADYIPMLVEQLATMATKKTNQCASVCTWTNALLRAHSALLLATVTSQPSHHLAQLLAIFTQRRSHLCQLLNLKGRLDLTVTQRNTCQQMRDEQEAVLQYNDSSSDEMEVEQYQSDSAHSWNESHDESAPEESGDEERPESDGD